MDLVQASNLLVMPFWLMMLFLPWWGMTQRVMTSLWPVVPAAMAYSLLVVPGVGQILPDLMNPSTAGIAALLGSDMGATVAWIHFLAFDLFAGRWIFLDSRKREISAWLSTPVLFCTLMFGPFGLLLHLTVRQFATRNAGAESMNGAEPI